MKRFALLLVALVLVSACDDDSDTAPNPSENRPRFTATLSPSQENPPITSSEQTATGLAVIHLNLTRDSGGAITAATTDFSVEMGGFPSTSVITAAHIHLGALGVNGGIEVNTGISNGSVALTNGAGSFTRTSIGTDVADAQAIINNPAGFYFNVHTVQHGGGVMRGQLVRQ
jgi:CHRD domain-containing protein